MLKHNVQQTQLSIELLEQDIIEVKKSITNIDVSTKSTDQSSITSTDVANDIRVSFDKVAVVNIIIY